MIHSLFRTWIMFLILIAGQVNLPALSARSPVPLRMGKIAYVDNPADGEIRDYFDAQSYEDEDGELNSMELREVEDKWE